MKLEVGTYVRTKKGIAKIICKNDDIRRYYPNAYITDTYLEINDDTEYVYEEDVLKASNNIIDLIEVGDIISYEYPTGLGMISYENVTILPELLNTLQNGENNHEYKIKSIVTKEQFKSMEYRLGDK